MKVSELRPEYHKNIPKTLDEGILYISKEFETAIHLCACGCKKQVVTPLWGDGWTLTEKDGKVTLKPSMGNWKGEKHSHYYITDNQIEWC